MFQRIGSALGQTTIENRRGHPDEEVCKKKEFAIEGDAKRKIMADELSMLAVV